jgi:ribonuclease P protein component
MALSKRGKVLTGCAQTNVATKETAPAPSARIHGADANTRWPKGHQRASFQGQTPRSGVGDWQAGDRRPHMATQAFPREQRLRHGSDFQALRERGFSRAHPLCILRAAANGLPYPRIGFIVGRRVAAHAVDRNRVRRRLREIARRSGVSAGWDVLLIARRDAVPADFQALREAVLNLERRAGVLEAPVPETEGK